MSSNRRLEFSPVIKTRLHEATIRRAMRRRHRPCKSCHNPKVICPQCTRMYCAFCPPQLCTHCGQIPEIMAAPKLVTDLSPTIPPLTQVPTVSTKVLERPKKDGPPPAPIHQCKIPLVFLEFAVDIADEGGIITKLTQTSTPGRWDLEVLIPANASLKKPIWGKDWLNHAIHTRMNTNQTRKGLLIDTVIAETPSVVRFK